MKVLESQPLAEFVFDFLQNSRQCLHLILVLICHQKQIFHFIKRTANSLFSCCDGLLQRQCMSSSFLSMSLESSGVIDLMRSIALMLEHLLQTILYRKLDNYLESTSLWLLSLEKLHSTLTWLLPHWLLQHFYSLRIYFLQPVEQSIESVGLLCNLKCLQIYHQKSSWLLPQQFLLARVRLHCS